MQFHAQDPKCGDAAVDLNTLGGSWKVPKEALTGDVTCEYTLTGADGKKYQMEFTAFKVGTTDVCTDDYVQVSFDGKFDDNTYKKCGTTIPEKPSASTTNVIKVKFASTSANAGTNTFTAKITEVPAPAQDPKCGDAAVDLNTLGGSWKVPKEALTGDVTCEYTLTGADGKKYQMEFTNFKVGTTDVCTGDYVQVSFDGKFDDNTYKKCGTMIPEKPSLSTTNVINVKLVSTSVNAATNTFAATIKENSKEALRVCTALLLSFTLISSLCEFFIG
ncbi:unnamed protein product [Echinostoma caproni]|uniref:CUB domain-containing protein n=1 Tax=Echinostoma caproni TaxID=27848 RepID=A0A183AHD2_9TREM|nr:unnamed protein product [Echinostoma caproni]